MIPDPQFIGQPKTFWATVRAISEESGYTARGTGQIKIHSINSMVDAYNGLGLDQRDIVSSDGSPNQRGQNLLAYFNYRARVLNTFVESNLMDVAEAASLFSDYRARLAPSCPLPMNKQTGEKKAPAYLTGLVNMLVEANSKGLPCNYDPKQLTAITKHNRPLRTLARRVDGAFPSTIDPIAVWEIKEYYYTTTFGSRVADGVYESLLDGMELEELWLQEAVKVQHILIIDSHFTWWECGRSYLCRIVDMLHMGYVDEVLFGREVIERLPVIVATWCDKYEDRRRASPGL